MDQIIDQWATVLPALDTSPMAVVGRVSRASRLLERSLKEFFQEQGLEAWEFDVLATLRRAGEPHQLRVGELQASLMVNSPTLTSRLDRLVGKGLVDRQVDPLNRRSVIVSLTPEGRALVDDLVPRHVANEARLLAFMPVRERAQLAKLLRSLLVGLSDVP